MTQQQRKENALSQTELALIAGFLDTAAQDFAGHSGNDFLLPASEENKAIFLAVLEHHNRQGDREHELTAEGIADATDEVFIYDDWAMAYFAERCGELAKRPGVALTPAELFAMGDLLAYAYEDHEGASGRDLYKITLPATPEHKAIVAATVELYRSDHAESTDKYGRWVAKQIKKVDAALGRGGEIEIPDFWVMYHLAHKCRALSGSTEPLYPEEPPDDEIAFSEGYTPTEADLRGEALRKELSALVRARYKYARTSIHLAGDRYLSLCIIANTDDERDTLYRDKVFVDALDKIRAKAELQQFQFGCFAFISDKSDSRRDAWNLWWVKGTCPQIGNAVSAEPVPVGQTDCPRHGRQGVGPICMHVADAVDRREKVGFVCGDDTALTRPTVWCARCDKALAALKGASFDQWYEDAGFEVVCALCWDEAKVVCGG